MAIKTNKVGTFRVDTGFMARFVVAPGQTIAIQLDYYCRYWILTNNSSLASIGHWSYSRKGAESPIGSPEVAHSRLFWSDPPLRRDFWRDNEGPPYIFVHAPSGNPGSLELEFEYYPSAIRDTTQVMPSRGGDYPTAATDGGLIVPGL